MKSRKIIMTIFSILILVILFIIFTNYSCIKKNIIENKYKKDNGGLLIYGLASTFDAWGNSLDTSFEYLESKECIDNLGNINREEATIKIKEVSKNNIIVSKEALKTTSKNTIFINQCILLKDIKVLYLTYNTFFSDTNKSINISLYDDMGNKISDKPNYIDIKKGLIMKNSENYFWGINFDKANKIILHIEVYSKQGEFLYDYDQLLYQK
jgi:hypothetical protein